MRTLLRWAGDDPAREGLLDTPRRVAKAFEELFAGYRTKPADVLDRVFEEVDGYDDIVLVRDIPFTPIASTTWCPSSAWPISPITRPKGVVGLSKLARVVDVFARRLQTQESHDGCRSPTPSTTRCGRAASP